MLSLVMPTEGHQPQDDPVSDILCYERHIDLISMLLFLVQMEMIILFDEIARSEKLKMT